MLKWFLLNIRFRGDIREISDSAQANCAESNFLLVMNIYEKHTDFSKTLKISNMSVKTNL